MRIVIATVTAGGGHLAAAAALEDAWRQTRPGDTVERIDVLTFASPLNRRLHADGYVQIAEHAPELWGILFDKTDNPKVAALLERLRKLFPSRSRVKFGRYLDGFDPDAVLCTHYMPLWTLSAWKHTTRVPCAGDQGASDTARKKPVLVASVVTDFDAHALWMDGCVDLYCVAADETKARLVARGVPEQNVVVTGIPIAPRFSQRPGMRAARRALGLQSDMPVVLVLSGGFGMGAVAETVVALDNATAPFQMVVVCGRNEKLRADIAARAFTHPTRVLGFVSNMHELMAAANLIVTKAGGLTTSEALAVGRPLLIVNPIPGQESANCDFLLEHGAATKANRVEDVPRKVTALLGSKKLLGMARAAKRLGRPNAAFDICREVISRLEVSK
ncbi:MAG: glycosyltransferase [Verrucomicrobiae bacterium]|nr:glycosyltransferase [Verrucomicrobiae bacterium]